MYANMGSNRNGQVDPATDMMLQYHHELAKLHNKLVDQNYKMAETQAQIANLNEQMYMHMMDEMHRNGGRRPCGRDRMWYGY